MGCKRYKSLKSFKALFEKQENKIDKSIKNLLTQWEAEEKNQLLKRELH